MSASGPQLQRTMGLRDVVLLNLAAIIGLRWMAIAARTGGGSLVLWGLALLCFFVPYGLAVLELSTRFPEEGGIYTWTRTVLGDFHGYLCGWCYWVNNLFFFPTMLLSAAALCGKAAPWLSPLSQSKGWSAVFTLVCLWGVVLGTVLGGRSRLLRLCHQLGALGNYLPPLLLLLLCGGALLLGHRGQSRYDQLLPVVLQPGTSGEARLTELSYWANMCFAFAGLELCCAMSGEIRSPQRTLPRALIISGVIVALAYGVGTAAILFALPAKDVDLMTGMVQAAQRLSDLLHLPGLGPLMALLAVLGSLGMVLSWFEGSARIPFTAGLSNNLPAAFSRLHPRFGTPYVALLVQGGLSTLVLLLSILGRGTSLESVYLALMDMTLIIYFIPYLYLFVVLVRTRGPAFAPVPGGFRVPLGRAGVIGAALLGGVSTVVAVLVSTHLPADVAASAGGGLGLSAAGLFRVKVVGGCLAFVLMGVGFHRWGRAAIRP